ncbi:DUF4214 domain-containing protein [uncultured Massilia sp.]|uniref:DUF4214 domain-containing protein n=1 Tax=uncultured Massilia sp. TaxID=169973 RepID=UPI0025FCFE7E|nr:DUF4214 domain-containing protein [uncultured Massilia sp.]
MASITIRLSQDVIDQQQALGAAGSPYGSLDDLLGNADPAGYGLPDVALRSWNLDGSTLRVDYTQGVTETYIGFRPDDPNASAGHATASAYELRQAGAFKVTTSGLMNFDYALGAEPVLETSNAGHLLNTLRIATEYATTSPDYDPVFGNVAFSLGGRLGIGPTGELNGLVDSITVQADKLLRHAGVEGRLVLDPALSNGMYGTVDGYVEDYYDGSSVVIAGLGADANQVDDLGAVYTNAAVLGGSDVIDIALPDRLPAAVTVRAGAGADRITLKGGGGLLGVDAGDGDDVIVLAGGAHAVDGGSGLDIARLAVARAAVNVTALKSAGGVTTGYTVTDAAGVAIQLANVERLVFGDTAYALDIDGHGGQAYRLYQAAFARTPDQGGLGFWIDALDRGQGVANAAQGFIDSNEYRAAYGAATSHRELVNKYYENILHRAPDAGGLDFWTGVLDSHGASVAQVLAAISESTENREGTAALIGNGFAYTPWG